MGIGAHTELERPTCSAWVVLKQISEISCDFQTEGAPPKVITCPCHDFTAFASPLGSCPQVPAKFESAHAFKLNVPLCFIITPLLMVPAGQQMMHSMALACDSFGHAVHCVT